MTAQSWDGGQHDDPRLRLTAHGRAVLRVAIAGLLVLAFAIGFLIRTPLDRAVLERNQPIDMPAHNARSERTT